MANEQGIQSSVSSLRMQAAGMADEVRLLGRTACHARSRVILAAARLDLRSLEDWLRRGPDELRLQSLEHALEQLRVRLDLARQVCEPGRVESARFA